MGFVIKTLMSIFKLPFKLASCITNLVILMIVLACLGSLFLIWYNSGGQIPGF